MIKADVNVTGTIKRSAVVRTDKTGKPYLAFIVTVNLIDSQNETMPVDIYVTVPNGQQSELAQYTEGIRVTINGMMDVHKKDENLSFFLEANLITTEGVADLDVISGTMTFRGHLRNENVYEEKQTKNGKPFIRFSAYSAEKNGENFISTWVSFMRFPAKDADISTIKPDWMCAKAHVEISGTFELQIYKGMISLGSLVNDMKQYVKPEYVQQ